MRTILRIRLDVGSLQCRQRVFLRGSTRSTVRVHDGHAEDPLSQARRNELWRSVTRRVFANEHRLRGRHLFDEGYISFSSSQELVIVPEVRDKLLGAWGIDAGVRVGEFSREQNAYLDYHRSNVFKQSLLE